MADRLIARLALIVTTPLSALPAAPASYSERPVRMLVPDTPGGADEAVARVFAPGLAAAPGQPIVVDNGPGSNGNLSIESAA